MTPHLGLGRTQIRTGRPIPEPLASAKTSAAPPTARRVGTPLELDPPQPAAGTAYGCGTGPPRPGSAREPVTGQRDHRPG